MIIPQWVRLPRTRNLRRLDGYPAADGRVIAPGKLYRAELLATPGTRALVAHFDPSTRAEFAALGIATVIDLRTPTEAERIPSLWADASGGEPVAIPIMDGAEGSDTDLMGAVRRGEISTFTAADLGAYYMQSLDLRAKAYGRVVSTIAGRDRLPALIHCAAGKDRTGLAVALLLAVLGTPRKVIIADYKLTEQAHPNRVEYYADALIASGVRPEHLRALFETPAEAMAAALDNLDARYGSVERYLVDAAGVDPAALAALREALLVPATETWNEEG